jgi:hypothetical protein
MKSTIRAFALCLIVAFASQIAWAGGGTVHVRGYTRKDGTYVHAYDRRAPGTAGTSTISTSEISVATTTAPVVVPAATPDSRSSSQTLQDAIAAGRIVVKATKPTVTSTTTTVSASGTVVRDSHGRIKRSESAKHEFMRMTGYPHGRAGYVVDHIVPLKRDGCDCPSNMQWQTIQEAKAKDKSE